MSGAGRTARVVLGALLVAAALGVPATPAAAVTTYKVKVQVAHGAQPGPQIRVWDRTTWKAYDVPVAAGADFGTADLPSGSYLTIGAVTDWGNEARLLPKAFAVSGAAATVTLDADLARPAGVGVDDSTAARVAADAWFTLPNGDAASFDAIWGTRLYVTPISLPGLTLNVHDVLQKGGSGPNRPSPYRYDLLQQFHDGSPATPTVSVLTSGLAKKTTTVRAQGVGVSATLWTSAATPEGQSGPYEQASVPVETGYTHYLTPGATIDRYVEYGTHTLDMPGLDLPAGDAGAEYVGRAPFSGRHSQFPSSTYGGGKFTLQETSSLADAYGHEGRDNGGQTVYQVTGDTTVLGSSGPLSPYDPFTVTAGSHTTYKISHTVTRAGAHSRLSTRVATDWAFPRTALPGAGSGSGELPVLDPQVTVAGLVGRNRAVAGSVQVAVKLIPRIAGTVATLTAVESSTDDGATWTPAAATATPGTVTVGVPATAAFVSLRVTGKDDKGGTVRQTLLRAFGGPAPETALKIGATTVGGVVVNGGAALVPQLTGLGGYSVAFTAADPSGISAAGVYLFHGPYDKPDGILPVTAADCVKRSGSTTYDCTAGFNLSGRGNLGLNKLAGTWSVAAWAFAGDKTSLFSGPVAGSAAIKRGSALTADATPEPVDPGATLTVTGTLTGSAWEYGAPAALAGQKVELQFLKAGSTTWTTLGSGTTDATGKVAIAHAATVDGGWRLRYAGSASSAARYSPVDTVDVR